MNIRAKSFERRLKQKLKPFDLRMRMSFWRRLYHDLENIALPQIPLSWPRGLLSVGLMILVSVDADWCRANPELFMGGIACWGFLITFFRAALIDSISHSDGTYRALWILPVPANGIFRYARNLLIAGSPWLFLEFLVAYGLHVTEDKSRLAIFAAVIFCATLQAASSVGLSLLIVLFRPVGKLTGFLLVLSGMLLSFGLCEFPYTSKMSLVALNLIVPPAWINRFFLNSRLSGAWLSACWLSPALALALFLPSLFAAFRRRHHESEFRNVQTPRIPGRVLRPVRPSAPPVPNSEVQRGLVREAITLQRAAQRKTRVLEALIARALSLREKVITETLLEDGALWTRVSIRIAISLIVILVANRGLKINAMDGLSDVLLDPVLSYSKAPPGTFPRLLGCAAGTVGLLFGIRTWFGSIYIPEKSIQSCGKFSGWKTPRLLPMNYWEIATAITKVTVCVTIILLPLACAVSVTPLWEIVSSMVDSINGPHHALLVKFLVFVSACMILIYSLPMTPPINSLRYWRTTIAKILLAATVYLLGAGMVASTSIAIDVALFVGLLLVVAVWLVYYGAKYRRGAFG